MLCTDVQGGTMYNPLDPITVDLLLTVLSAVIVLAGASLTLLTLPWTDAEIAATEAAADRLLRLGSAPMPFRSPPIQIQSTR
jgi:hypothetical protein